MLCDEIKNIDGNNCVRASYSSHTFVIILIQTPEPCRLFIPSFYEAIILYIPTHMKTIKKSVIAL